MNNEMIENHNIIYLDHDVKKKNINIKIDELLSRIIDSKNESSTRLFMVTEAYDKYNREYYIISLTILILSSIITFIEAVRLSIIHTKNTDIILISDTLNFTLHILLLVNGTIITILSSIIRFKNYREFLEGLKDAQLQLVKYKNKYMRQYYIIKYNFVNKIIEEKDIIKISDKITSYDRVVKSINYFQFIKNSDIIRYNKIKAQFDVSIYKIKTSTTNNFEAITKKRENEYININNKNDINREFIDHNKFVILNNLELDKDKLKINISEERLELNNKFKELKNNII
jgi:hypothetical protein|tara:strand:+ start:669 stop:1529 length:861 start_codon:yes stop_codon:yes gene_type:complete